MKYYVTSDVHGFYIIADGLFGGYKKGTPLTLVVRGVFAGSVLIPAMLWEKQREQTRGNGVERL